MLGAPAWLRQRLDERRRTAAGLHSAEHSTSRSAHLASPAPNLTSHGRSRCLTVLEMLLLCDATLRAYSGPSPAPPHPPRGLPLALHAMYLRLLTNAEFKSAYARAYALHYAAIAQVRRACPQACPLPDHVTLRPIMALSRRLR